MTAPEVITRRDELRRRIAQLKAAGRTLGFVPTMGALHAGHLSLVRAAREACGTTIVSIFVNPTQFGPQEDLAKYPRTLPSDLAALAAEQADLVYAPAVDDVYRPGHETYVEVGAAAERWEGAARPGHFRGVATVVLKLLNLVQPDVAFFGQKDFQQCLVVRKLAADLDIPVEIRVCPTVREPDGLAMSSRNVYLEPPDRQAATLLSQALELGVRASEAGERSVSRLLARMGEVLEAEPRLKVDYLAIADRETLDPIERLDRPAVALVAARVGSTRLIDNMLL